MKAEKYILVSYYKDVTYRVINLVIQKVDFLQDVIFDKSRVWTETRKSITI